MRDLQGINSEYCDCCIDAEALQAGQDGVGPDKEGNDVSEGGYRHRNPGVLHGLTEQLC